MQFPYIGACDVSSSEQIKRLFNVFVRNRKWSSNRLLMPGLMMTYKTLHGLPTKWLDIFPPKNRIKEIFAFRNPLILNTLHYADYEGIDVANSLELATKFAGPHLDALQLDMIWPEIEVLRNYRKAHPTIKIVQQIGANAFDLVSNNPETLVERLKEYGETIDYVLLDKSMGTGKKLDAVFLAPFISAIRNALPHLGIGVAGRLGPETMDPLVPLAKEFEDLSCDMQSGLRPTYNAMDPIDIERTENAILKALEILP